MKRLYLLIASMLASLPASVMAQTPSAPASPAAPAPNLVAGAKVFDSAGDEVGTVVSVVGGTVVLDTGTHRASLAVSSFATNAKGPVFGMTKSQLNAAIEEATAKSAAALDAALVVGADIRSQDGVVVGKVKEIQADSVVVDRSSGAVALPKRSFLVASGGLGISMTAQQLEEAIAKTSAAAKTSN
ncbi:MAG: hypothetical protein RLZZ444_3312 [Pseudomonadota bacterium]|jgi:sporulation protein YlmC with PRC-barrel domain